MSYHIKVFSLMLIALLCMFSPMDHACPSKFNKHPSHFYVTPKYEIFERVPGFFLKDPLTSRDNQTLAKIFEIFLWVF